MMKYFECSCGSPEHRLVITVEDNKEFGDPPEIYTETYVHNYRNFFKRCWVALKYVFGFKNKYGHFDCFTMQQRDVCELEQVVACYKQLVEEWANKTLGEADEKDCN